MGGLPVESGRAGWPGQRAAGATAFAAVRRIVEPADGPLDALAVGERGRPAEPRLGLLGAVFEVAAHQPGRVAGDQGGRACAGSRPFASKSEGGGEDDAVGDRARGRGGAAGLGEEVEELCAG